jgi:hypothetical protein
MDPGGTRRAIKRDTTSNNKLEPIPLSPANRSANHIADEAEAQIAKRLGLGQCSFLLSMCGAASTPLAFNASNARARTVGGFFDTTVETALEAQIASPGAEGQDSATATLRKNLVAVQGPRAE